MSPVVLGSARTPGEDVRTPGGYGPRAIGPRAKSRGSRGRVLGHRVGMDLRWSSAPLGHRVEMYGHRNGWSPIGPRLRSDTGMDGPRAIGPRVVVPERWSPSGVEGVEGVEGRSAGRIYR
ncbi:MAG: hypothetical protein FMNOHCHN_01548 [Ignavibacteriaceae bacterium]|nr:hypothetical protein [Ignavibacteriaceae bacterium]